MTQRVPAYDCFLKENGVKCTDDFESLPLTDKHNYLLSYPVSDLCWDGTLKSCHLIGASSGFSKTGSVFWPKRPEDEGAYLESVENMLVDNFHIDEKSTLALVCLAFGTWIGGIQIASAFRMLASTGRFPFTIATPGLNIAEAVDVCERFMSEYDQVLCITNPSNVNLVSALFARHKLKPVPGSFFFPVVGEYFPESFREHIAETFGHPKDEPFCVWTGYGSADTGDLGVETRSTIALRKVFNSNHELSKEFFGEGDTPMLLAPNPHAHIEIISGNIVVTKNQLVPLVRYNTKDTGGLFERKEVESLESLDRNTYESLPDSILFVRGRASDSIVFYGTNLMTSEINDYFLSLSSDFHYGGLFQVRTINTQGFAEFEFIVYTTGPVSESFQSRYCKALLEFLKKRSLEFSAKYDPLSQSVGQPLISVILKDVAEIDSSVKHKFILED